MTKQDTDEYLTPDEACRYLGVTRRTLERYGEEGRLTKYKRGITRNVFYKKSELDSLLRFRPVDEE